MNASSSSASIAINISALVRLLENARAECHEFEKQLTTRNSGRVLNTLKFLVWLHKISKPYFSSMKISWTEWIYPKMPSWLSSIWLWVCIFVLCASEAFAILYGAACLRFNSSKWRSECHPYLKLEDSVAIWNTGFYQENKHFIDVTIFWEENASDCFLLLIPRKLRAVSKSLETTLRDSANI